MKRHACSIVCLTMLVLIPAAWGQSNGLDSTDTSAVANASTDTASQPASDLRQAIRQELRNTFAQVLVDMIQQFFDNLRLQLGLPADPTDPTTDPLAILESAIENVVNEKVVNDSVGQ